MIAITYLLKEHNHTCKKQKQFPQLLKLLHDACIDQVRECKELISREQNLQNIQGHILQGQQGHLQQVLSSLYPAVVNHESVS